jgi:hypothetical protein
MAIGHLREQEKFGLRLRHKNRFGCAHSFELKINTTAFLAGRHGAGKLRVPQQLVRLERRAPLGMRESIEAQPEQCSAFHSTVPSQEADLLQLSDLEMGASVLGQACGTSDFA